MLVNNYYSIACNDLVYLQYSLHLPFYNNIAAQCQQVAEKFLKSVAELCVSNKDVLNSHNLRRINEEIKQSGINLHLPNKDLSLLKDYYFDARYPGDDFIVVSEEECAECVLIMNNVYNSVNDFRREKGLDVVTIECKTLQIKKENDERSLE